MRSGRWAMLAAMGMCVVSARGGDVVRVGTVNGMIEGEITLVSLDAVWVRTSGDEGRLLSVPWYELRVVEDGFEVPAEFAELARCAAIGHARRARGDLRGCAEMYARIAGDLIGLQSNMALEVFGGLVEEAVMRGDPLDAAIALMAIAPESREGIEGVDNRLGVHAGVPMVRSGDGFHRLTTLGDAIVAQEGTVGSVVVRAFRVVNGIEDGDVAALLDAMDTLGRDDFGMRMGLELYAVMLRAQCHPDADEREGARVWLDSRADSKSGTWIEAWCRLAAGVSYLRDADLESGSGMRSRGVVELVHVIAGVDGVEPAIVRTAYTLAMDGLQSGGRFEEAAELARGMDSLVMKGRD